MSLGPRIAHVRFVNPDHSPLKGPDTSVYVYWKKPSGQFDWEYEFLVDKDGKYRNVRRGSSDTGQEERVAEAASDTVQLVVAVNDAERELWVVCAPRQLTPNKAKETARYARRGAKVEPLHKVVNRKTGVPVGTWMVVVDPSGDSLTESGKCEMSRIVLAGSTRKIETSKPVVQLVPAGLVTDTYGFSTELFESMKNWTEMKHEVERAGGVRALAKELREKTAEKNDPSWGVACEKSFAILSDGVAEIEPDIELATRCKLAHQLTLSGGGTKKLQPKETLKLAWNNKAGGTLGGAKPSVYTLSAKGCAGATKNLQVEVFPPDQYLFAWELKFSRKGGDNETGIKKLFTSLSKTLSFLPGKPSVGFSVGFAIEGGMGWREESDNWKAAFTTEVGMKLSFGATFSMTFSALQLTLQIPQDVSDYLADIRFTIGLEGKATISGAIEQKRFSDGSHKGGGSISGEGSLAMPMTLKGYVGKEGLLSVGIVAEARPGIKVKVGIVFESGSVNASLGGKYDNGDIVVTVVLDAHIKKKTTELNKWTLWNEGDIGTLGPWPIYEAKKK